MRSVLTRSHLKINGFERQWLFKYKYNKDQFITNGTIIHRSPKEQAADGLSLALALPGLELRRRRERTSQKPPVPRTRSMAPLNPFKLPKNPPVLGPAASLSGWPFSSRQTPSYWTCPYLSVFWFASRPVRHSFMIVGESIMTFTSWEWNHDCVSRRKKAIENGRQEKEGKTIKKHQIER